MFLEKIIYRDFLLVHHDWPLETAATLITRLSPPRVIVTHPDPLKRFDLFLTEPLLDMFGKKENNNTVFDVIPSDGWPGVALGKGYDDADSSPDQVIVLDEQDQLLGFYDVDFPPEESVRHTRALHRRGDQPIAYRACSEFPESVVHHQPFEFKVILDRKEHDDETYPLSSGKKVKVSVFGRQNLSVLGTPFQEITLSQRQEEGREHIFRFELLPTDVGVGKIEIIVAADGFQGRIQEICRIRPAGNNRGREVRQLHNLYPSPEEQMDLSLVIQESSNSDHHTIVVIPYQTSRGDLEPSYGPVELKTPQRRDLPEKIFAEIDHWKAVRNTEDWPPLRLNLEKTCAFYTHQLLSPSLREQLWKLKDRIKSLQVISNEMDIPWELCRLDPPDGQAEGFYFAEKWQVVRWLNSDNRPYSQRITDLKLDRVGLVFAPNSGDGAKKEKENLIQILSENATLYAPEPPEYCEIYERLDSDRFDCWHFVGHSEFNLENPDFSRLMIDGRHGFRPCDLVTTQFTETAPIVFLNGCQTGRTGKSLNDTGGWAKRFLDAGAGVFIGTYWNVKNQLSRYFSEAFYKQLKAGKTLGEAVHHARLHAMYQTGDPTWLAYTVYGDPRAVVAVNPVAELFSG